MNKGLWTKNFTTIIFASALGMLGNVAGGFALSFLVFDETRSTLAAAIIVALRVIPGFFIPLFVAPIMDRLPRKPFLVGCDAAASVVYVVAGLWLKSNEFNYIYYLIFSLIIASFGSFDELTYNSIYPKLLPSGYEEKGYAAASMLYPVITLIMTPLAAVLYRTIGAANILMIQGFLCLLSTLIESRIQLQEEIKQGTDFSIRQWWGDIKEAIAYLKKEKGILSMTLYSSTCNGMYGGYESLLVAFFSTMPGLSVTMYGFFTIADVIGRTIGGAICYKVRIKPEKKNGFVNFIYLFYDTMDSVLLWLPYPLMLVNRAICGYLGIQSGTLRYAAIQKYIPEDMRARLNAMQSVFFLTFSAVLAPLIGWLGDILDYRIVMTIGGIISLVVCMLTVVKNRKECSKIFTSTADNM